MHRHCTALPSSSSQCDRDERFKSGPLSLVWVDSVTLTPRFVPMIVDRGVCVCVCAPLMRCLFQRDDSAVFQESSAAMNHSEVSPLVALLSTAPRCARE